MIPETNLTLISCRSFGPDSEWLRNIQAKPDEEVTVGRQHFAPIPSFSG
jgi:hypothetical protein